MDGLDVVDGELDLDYDDLDYLVTYWVYLELYRKHWAEKVEEQGKLETYKEIQEKLEDSEIAKGAENLEDMIFGILQLKDYPED